MAKRKSKKVAKLATNGAGVAYFGGSFAPPIDKAMRDYGSLATSDEIEDPRARHALKTLFAAVDEFLGTDVKTASATAHPSGVGFITKLDEATVEALDEKTPFPEEIKTMGAWLEACNQAEAEAHGKAIEAWQTALVSHLAHKHFKNEELRRLAKLTKLSPDAIACLPESVQKDVAEASKCREAAVDEFIEAMRTKSHADVPYPQRPTDLLFHRDAAHHLLWYANELSQDRVPLTSDKLPRA